MAETITDRQLEIITAAGKILTTSGIGGLTIKNLAKEMKFSESAIYRHFSSKEKIIITMLHFLAKTLEEQNIAISNMEINNEEKLMLLFRSKFNFFGENPHFVVAVFSDGLMEESTTINHSISKIMNINMKHLKPIVLEGQSSGLIINTLSENDVMHIIMGAMRLLMFKWRVANFDFDIIESGEKMMKSLLTILKEKSNS